MAWMTIPDPRYLEHHPNRPVDWHWQLGKNFAAAPLRELHAAPDPLTLCAARFQHRLALCSTPQEYAALESQNPDLYPAFMLYEHGGWQRVLVESRMLASVPFEGIAERHHLTVGAVTLYADLFFDVTGRLGAHDYIVGHAIHADHQDDTVAGFVAQHIKRIGYFLGPDMLDAVVGNAFTAQGRLRRDPPDLSTADGRLSAMARLVVEAVRPGLTISQVWEVYRTSQELLELERPVPAAVAVPVNVLADIATAEACVGPSPAVVSEVLRPAIGPIPAADAQSPAIRDNGRVRRRA